jgi:lipoprotein-anchoring transpeptidase ErfK/SrfK
MKIKTLLLILLTVAITIFTFTINAKAEAATGFDPVYYANEYPDVVNALGTNPTLLYQHYVIFGVKEGRYQNQYEEDNKLVNTSGLNVNTAYAIQPIPGYTNYVDIDISDQVVTYFENGVIKMQTPCVTGLDNGKRNTPYGTFKILTKTPGKRLKGKTWNCWVDRWMRFTNNSIGLHDASWRSSFGGEIYKTNGSHGCVNLPKDAAYQLYDLVSVGTTVIVHE